MNQNVLKAEHTVISNASCTTNCLAPLVKPLHDKLGVETGLMTTVHAYTNDQVLTDVYHEDLRRARSATMSMIPTKTGAAAAVGLVLPSSTASWTVRDPRADHQRLAGRPVLRGQARHHRRGSQQHPAGRRRRRAQGHPDLQHEPLVSIDFNHNPASSNFDATLTKVSGKLVKVSSWYDNEWGFSNRMLDTTVALMSAK
ncbi:hypothetical protein [Bordetella bronchiseptica]